MASKGGKKKKGCAKTRQECRQDVQRKLNHIIENEKGARDQLCWSFHTHTTSQTSKSGELKADHTTRDKE